MITKPTFSFDNTTSTGLDLVPLNSVILIEDSDGAGTPLQVLLTDKTGITSATTISTFLGLTSQWQEFHGIVSGSNANGNYTKFPDGTMMCWYDGYITNSVEQTWTYPVAFVGVPHVHAEKDGGGTATPLQEIVGGRTTTTVLYNAYASDGVSITTSAVSLFAVGRWK